MKNKLLTAAIASVLCASTAANAASTEDQLAQIHAQLQSLIQRVDRLEQENATLKAENGQLKAHSEVSNQQNAEQSKQISTANVLPWYGRVSVQGDLRYRHQQTDDARISAERDEHLLRARLRLEGKITDTMVAALGLATSATPGNPRGANVQLDGEFSPKSLYVDLGYIDWTFATGAHAIGGKMKMPFVRPGQSLFWDNDINPEGIALTYDANGWFGSVYGFWVDENVQAATAASANDTTDTKMYGAQIGNRFTLGSSTLALAASYYDLAAGQGRRPFYGGSSNGNSLNASGGLAYDFRVVGAMAQLNTKLGDLPLQVWADLAQNQDAKLDTAIGVGAMLGKAAKPRSWETGLQYQFIQKDALFAQHIDSDFAAGLSDSEGWVLRAGYAPLENWTLIATYLITSGNVDVGNEFAFDRLMLDFNAKF